MLCAISGLEVGRPFINSIMCKYVCLLVFFSLGGYGSHIDVQTKLVATNWPAKNSPIIRVDWLQIWSGFPW